MEEFSPTKAIYLQDDAKHTSVCTVLASLSCADKHDEIKNTFSVATDADYVVVTDSTIFYAKGGGQPSDVGYMTAADDALSTFGVKAVHKLPSGAILHLGTFSKQPFEPQATVTQNIDTEVRNLHSKIHDAGHILASAVRSLNIPGIRELKAQHYPDVAFVDFEGIIPGDKKEEIARLANEIVDQDRSIAVQWWTKDELEEKSWTMPKDMGDTHDQLFPAVEIQGVGAYVCGGTHVHSTSLVGRVRVRKIKRQQGVTRISYEIPL